MGRTSSKIKKLLLLPQFADPCVDGIVRYKKLNHTVNRPIRSVDMTTGETLYSSTMVVTHCGSSLSLVHHVIRPGVPTCMRCLAHTG